MSRAILSAFSDEYAESFREQLAGMQSLGISHIELRHVDGINVSKLSQRELGEVRRMLEDFGITTSAIGSPIGKICLDGDLAEHREMAKRIFETAELLGARFVRIFSFYAPKGESIADKRDAVCEELERLLELASSYNVTLCHENEAKIYGDTPARCRELLDLLGGRMRCVFDMGNFVLEKVVPYPEAYHLLRPYISYFHIKDALPNGHIVPPGKGEGAIREILTAHQDFARDDFFISLEPHLQVFSGLESLVGRGFENPYRYPDAKSAFTDAVYQLKELMAL